MTGKVKCFNNTRGYGFIENEKEELIFVHYINIIDEGFRTLKENEKVIFDVKIDNRGMPFAVNVRKYS